MTNLKTLLAATVSTVGLMGFAPSAMAQQVPIDFRVCQGPNPFNFCANNNQTSYIGPGFDSAFPPNSSSVAGGVSEASATNFVVNDAYDGWGAIYGASNPAVGYNSPYGSEFNGLTANRQTQTYVAVGALPANSIRWFDSFTNNTGSAITANIAFGGNLGSDGNTFVHAIGPGYFVTGQGAPGALSTDPVIAHLYGNNDYAFNQATLFRVTNGDDNPYVVYPITVAPGQTVSIMFVNLLYGDAARSPDPAGAAYAADVALAIQNAQLFLNSPVFDGLTADQIATLINWNVNVNGALPGAGAIPGISLGLHDAFFSFLNADGTLAASGASTNGSIEPLQYADVGQPRSNGTQAFAMALGEAGGNMTLTSTGEARSFLFGGYTTGDVGYTAGTLDFNGYILGLGAERAVTTNMVFGIAGGYAEGDGDISGVYNSITNRELIISPYARLSDGAGTTLDGRLSFASESWEYDRVAGAGVANADFDGWSFGARVALAHTYSAGEYTFTPLASLSYLRTSVNGYSETNAGAANLVVPSFVQEHGEAFAGITAARDWVSSSGKAMRGFFGAGVGTGFLGDETIQTNLVGSATAFATQVQGVNDTFARVSAGFTAEIQAGLKFSATYTGTFGEDREQHTLGGKLIASF